MRSKSPLLVVWVAITVLTGLGVATPMTDSGGKARTFEWTLTWDKFAPDGFYRDMILVNGKFPGPKMELNENDEVEVLVHNKMPFDTAIHYHGRHANMTEAHGSRATSDLFPGIEMRHTPWSDGVPGTAPTPQLPFRTTQDPDF